MAKGSRAKVTPKTSPFKNMNNNDNSPSAKANGRLPSPAGKSKENSSMSNVGNTDQGNSNDCCTSMSIISSTNATCGDLTLNTTCGDEALTKIENGNCGSLDTLGCVDVIDDGINMIDGGDEVNQLQKLMEEEEKKAEVANEREEEKLKKELEARRNEEKELQEQRYKRLMHLLTKSEFYSQFLLEKIDSQAKVHKTKKNSRKIVPVSEEEKENTSAGLCSGSSQDSDGSKKSTRGRKRQAAEEDSGDVLASHEQKGGRADKKRKKALGSSSYQISEVINKEAAKAAATGQAEEEEVEAEVQPPQLLTGVTLRPYQLDGFQWLKVMYENGVNGLLADEMGLGKTVQSLALLAHLVEMGVPGPFLVVAPLSTLHNWCNEIRAFTPQLPCVLFHGSELQRREKLALIKQRHPVTLTDDTGNVTTRQVLPIVVTSYEMAINSQRDLTKFMWRYLVVDEGHRIKNSQCRLVKALKQYPCTNRLLLTGTPLQNSLSELWSLLNFLLPEVFDSLDVFESWFDVTRMNEAGAEEMIVQQEKEKKVITTLHKILSPFLLRRVKTDVALHLPIKRELLVYAHMAPLQLQLYTATLTRDFSIFNQYKEEAEEVRYDSKGRPVRSGTQEGEQRLRELLNTDDSEKGLERFLTAAVARQASSSIAATQTGKKNSMNVKLQNVMMQCRRVVNHPYLIAYPLTPEGEYKVDEALVTTCGKLQVLDQLLTELQRRGHKVLLFSQMTMLLDILHDYLTLRPQFTYRRLDGRVGLEDRQVDIDTFNKDPNVFLFLLSTRAGSLGINLTAADTVIIYDSDWNPQQDLQAQDRCHRIGQTRPVLVLRLVTAASVDERIVERANSKRCLEKLIIKAGQFTNSKLDKREVNSIMDRDELLRLLEQRDHHSIYRTAGTGHPGAVFSTEELDRILDRSELEGKTCGLQPGRKGKMSKKECKSSAKSAGRARQETKTEDESSNVFKVLEEL